MIFGKTKETQRKQIAGLLIDGKSITSMEAFRKYGITRLSAVIFDLKNDYGMDIVSGKEYVKDRNKRTTVIARYYLKEYTDKYEK